MPKNFDVCIRGDGIVGRTLALLLARERLRVALVAQPAPTPMAEDVRAYALNDAAARLAGNASRHARERDARLG
jgi:2-polyprenyl-6-methoxyphenol hydroxylase-like FAD-dependent oxidoreductase